MIDKFCRPFFPLQLQVMVLPMAIFAQINSEHYTYGLVWVFSKWLITVSDFPCFSQSIFTYFSISSLVLFLSDIEVNTGFHCSIWIQNLDLRRLWSQALWNPNKIVESIWEYYCVNLCFFTALVWFPLCLDTMGHCLHNVPKACQITALRKNYWS